MGDHWLATPDLNRIFRGETVAGLSEWQLLERYLEARDEVAFEALVARHGPMVLAVCRRMLADQTDVDDAFQATFLVLVRRARHLGPRDAIGPWLHGVAARVAMRARSVSARRRRFKPISAEVPAIVDTHSPADREIGEVLDQEVGRLPSKYRFPVVLCYLEGQTHEEAARQLKWPIGTVKGRLARARDLLRSRLLRRGLTPSVGALTLALSRESSAALGHDLVDRTVRSSMKIALGQVTAQVVSASIVSLVEGVLTSMLITTFKWASLTVLVGGLALTGVGVMARQNAGAKNEEPRPALKALAVNAEPETPAPISPDNVATPKANPDGRAKDPKSQQILAKLEQPISMSFNEETPLEDVLKYVKQATTTDTYSGIPIYVDPLALQEAQKSMTSTVRNMDLEGVPLRRSLQLLLQQLDLFYFVDDGILCIAPASSEGRFRPAMREPSPILQRTEKAERGELSLAEMKKLTEILKARETIMKLSSVKRDEKHDLTGSNKQNEDAKQTREQMNLLLKEMRQLIEVLKAEKRTQKTDEGK